MARKKEEGAAKAEAKTPRVLSDRKRFGYLRIRAVELRKESLAVKKEMSELRAKIGKTKGAAEGGAAAGDED